MNDQEGTNRAGKAGRIEAVSVGRAQDVDRNGRPERTAIYKTPIDGPVRAVGVSLEGDAQANLDVHGGYDKAVYAYADEDRRWFEASVGRDIDVGGFGENLTTSGLDLTNAVIGERWMVGSAELEVSEPRIPCWKLNHRMSDNKFVQRFNDARRPGTYLRIITEGVIEAGDTITVSEVPDHGLTVGDVAVIRQDRRGVQRLLAVEALSDEWKTWATRNLDRR